MAMPGPGAALSKKAQKGSKKEGSSLLGLLQVLGVDPALGTKVAARHTVDRFEGEDGQDLLQEGRGKAGLAWLSRPRHGQN